MNKQTTQQFGCKICRKLNDGICNSFCLMDKAQKQKFMKQHAHLFKNAQRIE